MSIHPAEFRRVGEALNPGKRTRIDHYCGDGRSLMVSRDTNGISAYCFRCRETGFIPEQLSLAERIARLSKANEADSIAQSVLELPGPGVKNPRDWPDEPRLWLYKAGFSNDFIEQLGFYWNPGMRRVVMPVKQDGKLVYWQARGFDEGRPKYINVVADRSKIVARYGVPGDVLVLTEDMLSAAKVSKVNEAWSILGVVLSPAIALEIATKGVPVIVALDPDPPGKAGGLAIVQQLSLMGVACRTAYMDKDPKFHSTQEISLWIRKNLVSCSR